MRSLNLIGIFTCFLFLYSCNDSDRVDIKEVTDVHREQSFLITTPNATYNYQKTAGGFSHIYDRNNIDWINFKKDSITTYPESAAGSFRGLPNLVFGSEDIWAGHPGFNIYESMLINNYQVQTKTRSGNWQWTWSFYNRFAMLDIEKTDPEQPYWFLYEGTIGGKYQPQFHYWGTNKGGPLKDIPDYFMGNEINDTWNWVYFGDEKSKNVFFIVHVSEDELVDSFSFLGNSKDGLISPDGMVVFGFGRNKGAKPLMQSERNKFLIGFYNSPIRNIKEHMNLEKYIDNLISEQGDVNNSY